jgi:hypothetical protein
MIMSYFSKVEMSSFEDTLLIQINFERRGNGEVNNDEQKRVREIGNDAQLKGKGCLTG